MFKLGRTLSPTSCLKKGKGRHSSHSWPNLFVLFSFLSDLFLSLCSPDISFLLRDAIYLSFIILFTCTLFNCICFPLHFKIFFVFFWKPQKPQATLILSKTLLGFNVDTLGSTLDLFESRGLGTSLSFSTTYVFVGPWGTKQQANFVSAKYSALQSPLCCLFGFGALSFPLPFICTLLTF